MKPFVFVCQSHRHRFLRSIIFALLILALAGIAPASSSANPPPTDLAQLLNQFDSVPLTADGSVRELRIPNTITAASVAQSSPQTMWGEWDDRFSPPGVTCCVGFSFNVFAVEVVGNDVYVAGEFREVGRMDGTSGVARWDGRRWYSLGGGLQRSDSSLGGQVSTMTVAGDNLFVAGDFDLAGETEATRIARWHIPTQTWHKVGSGVGPRDGNSDGSISTIAVVGTDIFVGGNFDQIDGVDAYRVAHWNGTAWLPLAGGVADETLSGFEDVNAVAASDDFVYVGGDFEFAVNPDNVPDVRVNNIAVWNRQTGRWSALGTGLNRDGVVTTLKLDGNLLYVGGRFSQAGGLSANNIARWNGTQWAALGSGVSGTVDDLKVKNNQLYVSGFFNDAGGVANTENLARWDGSQWQSLRSDLLMSDPAEDRFYAVGVLANNNVFVAGDFNDSGDPLVVNMAYWDGAAWRGTGMGFEDGSTSFIGGDSYAVAVHASGQVFVGGEFTEIGGQPVNRLAMWDGASWQDVGGSLNGDVSALLIRGDELYVGGGFTRVGNNLTAVKVAVYNIGTKTWAALGNGLPEGFVNELAFVGSTLYAGGSGFPSQTECCLWKWDGATWAPFSQRFRTRAFFGPFGARTSVQALFSDGEQLVVGGAFVDVEVRASAERIPSNDVFIYNPATDSISTFGTGADNGDVPAGINAITLAGDGLYVGGSFTSINNAPTVNIARLTNAGWGPVGTGALGRNGIVSTFAVNGTELYVGGSFDTAGSEAFNIARWDTAAQQWASLGCGIARNGETVSIERVASIAVQPSGRPNPGVYVAGGIAEAGCLPSMGFAIWYGIGTGRDFPPELPNRAFFPQVVR
jgi:hypothetical protein